MGVRVGLEDEIDGGRRTYGSRMRAWKMMEEDGDRQGVGVNGGGEGGADVERDVNVNVNVNGLEGLQVGPLGRRDGRIGRRCGRRM